MVESSEIITYRMTETGSHLIQTSNILNVLPLDLLEKALNQSKTSDQSSIGTWLMQEFQQLCRQVE